MCCCLSCVKPLLNSKFAKIKGLSLVTVGAKHFGNCFSWPQFFSESACSKTMLKVSGNTLAPCALNRRISKPTKIKKKNFFVPYNAEIGTIYKKKKKTQFEWFNCKKILELRGDYCNYSWIFSTADASGSNWRYLVIFSKNTSAVGAKREISHTPLQSIFGTKPTWLLNPNPWSILLQTRLSHSLLSVLHLYFVWCWQIV